MLMPELSFQIVTSAKARSTLSGGTYHLLGEKSSSLLYFDRLVQRGDIRKRSIRTAEATPDEVAALFGDADADLKAVQWFPYYRLLQLFNNCSYLIPANDSLRYRPNVMVGHREFLELPKKRLALEYAVRDAWLSLLESPAAMNAVVSSMTSDPEYLRFLSRSAGFHFVKPDVLQTGYAKAALGRMVA